MLFSVVVGSKDVSSEENNGIPEHTTLTVYLEHATTFAKLACNEPANGYHISTSVYHCADGDATKIDLVVSSLREPSAGHDESHQPARCRQGVVTSLSIDRAADDDAGPFSLVSCAAVVAKVQCTVCLVFGLLFALCLLALCFGMLLVHNWNAGRTYMYYLTRQSTG